MSSSWRDTLIDANLQPCSFRGVEMLWDANRLQGGRRLVVHQYPQRDKVEVEDLGGSPKRFSIDACVIGRDYASKRDALIEAFDASGAGPLVHPHYGNINARVESYEIEQTTQAGGMAAFRLQFVRDDLVTSPASIVDTQAAAASAATVANASAAAQFADAYSVPDAFARETALGRMTDVLKAAASKVSGAYGFGDAKLQQLQTALLDPVVGARALLQDSIDLPGALSYRLQSMISGVINIASLRALFARYQGGGDGDSKSVPTIDTLAQQTVAIAIAQQTSAADYPSYDQATAALAVATETLDAVSYTADDDSYGALQDLRTAVATDIGTRAADLARITSFTPRQTLPALVVAHRLYGPIDVEANAADVIARNRIVHPGFVRGGAPLEVLTP